MKKTFISFLSILISLLSLSISMKAQCNEWVVTGGTPTAVIQQFGSAVDSNSNVLIAAYIDSTYADFNGDVFTSNVLSSGDMLILTKVDSTGNNVWTKHLEADTLDILHGLHSDGSNFYLTTSFKGNLVINGQTISSIESSILIAKLDNNGNIVWFKTYELQTTVLQTTTRSSGVGITVDNSNNILVTGYFSGKLVFGNTILETTVLTEERQMFTMKLDSIGNEIWALQSTNMSSPGLLYNRGWALTTDSNDDVYVCGFYGGTFKIDTIAVQEPDHFLFNPYLVKLDGSTGSALWIQSGNFPTGSSTFGHFYDVTIDKSNNVIAVGAAVSDSLLTIGGTTIDNSYGKSILIIKFDTNSNIIFNKTFGILPSTGAQWASNVETDSDNNIYLSGNATSGTAFDNFTVNVNGRVSFMAKMDSIGNVQDLQYIHDANQISYTSTYSGVYDNFENIYISGTYETTNSLTFNNVNYPSSSSTDANGIFLLKACASRVGFSISDEEIDIPSTFSSIIFPNPNKGSFRVEINSIQTQDGEINIINELGQMIDNQQIQLNGGENIISYDLKHLPSGIYYIQIRANQYSNLQRFIKF